MTEEVEATATEEPEVLRVRYTGTANQRILTHRDMAGANVDNGARAFVFAPGDEVPWTEWAEMSGGDKHGREVLTLQAHEFELVGPKPDGFDDAGEAEFEVGGPAE